ncbi:unnamed protein product [Calicophoron daubneyi]|uniref:Uncharacterized protein n=1 Tax=Calicophoron daubneyi TaxID=300641 RepID=A0AAV2T0X2_CALDB
MMSCGEVHTHRLKLTSMGDGQGPNADGNIAGESNVFFVGETEPRREISDGLRERLTRPQHPQTDHVQRERETEQRRKDLQEQKLRKLHEHHEKVSRLAAQKKLKKKKEAEGQNNEEEQANKTAGTSNEGPQQTSNDRTTG